MTYDDWKLASPPEYEEDAPPAQPQRCTNCTAGRHERCADPGCECMDTITCGSPPRKRTKCAGCGGWTDGRHLDRELLTQAETDETL